MTLLPQYNSERMVGEYLKRFYAPACARGKEFAANGFAVARDVAAWKQRVRPAWSRVQVRALGVPGRVAQFGDKVRFTVGVRSDDLTPDDMVVELLLAPAMRELSAGHFARCIRAPLA